MKDDEIKGSWKNYFDKLLNEKHEESPSKEGLRASSERVSQEYMFCRRVEKFEVANAL